MEVYFDLTTRPELIVEEQTLTIIGYTTLNEQIGTPLPLFGSERLARVLFCHTVVLYLCCIDRTGSSKQPHELQFIMSDKRFRLTEEVLEACRAAARARRV